MDSYIHTSLKVAIEKVISGPGLGHFLARHDRIVACLEDQRGNTCTFWVAEPQQGLSTRDRLSFFGWWDDGHES